MLRLAAAEIRLDGSKSNDETAVISETAAVHTGLGENDNGSGSGSGRRRELGVTIVEKRRRQDNSNGDSNSVGASLAWIGERSRGSSYNQVPGNKLDGSIGIL